MNKLSALKEKIKKFDIYGNRRIFYIVPLVIILVMIICGLCYQFSSDRQYFANVGIDFQGGTILTIEFEDANANASNYKTNVEKISEVVAKYGADVSVDQSSGESTIIVQYTNWTTGEGSTTNDAEEMSDINASIQNDLYALSDSNGIDKIVENGINFSTIGNESSKNLLQTSAIAVAIALVLMLLYIIIRFDFYSGLAAVIALFHDIVIMLSLTVIFYVEISDSIVAGLITIVAYSINNTIVVFDRIRTSIKPYKKSGSKYDVGFIINNSVYSTMTRTLYTTLTTLVVMVILVAMGVTSIQTFGLPIIFGLIAGFYSSVFIAGPLWGELKDLGTKIKIKAQNKKFAKAHGAKTN